MRLLDLDLNDLDLDQMYLCTANTTPVRDE